ncbi:YSC84-related protein [Amylibacter sp.]|nr:YSC84-related protein [Amylibacter sp.]
MIDISSQGRMLGTDVGIQHQKKGEAYMQILRAAVLSFCAFMMQPAMADDVETTLENFRTAGAGDFIDDAYGYAVFPSIGKGGIGIGGAHGKGFVYQGGDRTGKVKMNQITYGLQLGGQVYSQMIFFRDERSFDDFTSGNFEFGAQATAVALTASATASTSTGGGGNASAGTDADSNNVSAKEDQYDGRSGMAVFTIAKGGLMYEATLGGQKFKYEAL